MSPVDCRVVYEVRCAACGDTHEEAWGVRATDPVPMPTIPPNWFVTAGRLYCPKHIVQVEIKVYPA